MRDDRGEDLFYCEKRRFAGAFTLLALVASLLSVGVAIAALVERWLVGPGLFIPANAQTAARAFYPCFDRCANDLFI